MMPFATCTICEIMDENDNTPATKDLQLLLAVLDSNESGEKEFLNE
jgi:hypothetical protein